MTAICISPRPTLNSPLPDGSASRIRKKLLRREWSVHSLVVESVLAKDRARVRFPMNAFGLFFHPMDPKINHSSITFEARIVQETEANPFVSYALD